MTQSENSMSVTNTKGLYTMSKINRFLMSNLGDEYMSYRDWVRNERNKEYCLEELDSFEHHLQIAKQALEPFKSVHPYPPIKI